MALRRMTGWIQEMERKRGEGDILDRSCVRIEKKFLFWSAETHFVVLSPARKRAEGQFAAARVKSGCVGDSCNRPHSYLQSLFCLFERTQWNETQIKFAVANKISAYHFMKNYNRGISINLVRRNRGFWFITKRESRSEFFFFKKGNHLRNCLSCFCHIHVFAVAFRFLHQFIHQILYMLLGIIVLMHSGKGWFLMTPKRWRSCV